MRSTVLAVLLLLAAAPAFGQEETLSEKTKKALAAFRAGDDAAFADLCRAPEQAAIATILTRSLTGGSHADHARALGVLGVILSELGRSQSFPSESIVECLSHESVECQAGAAYCFPENRDLDIWAGANKSRAVRGLVELAMSQRSEASEKAFSLLSTLTSVKRERAIVPWRTWFEARYNEMLDVRLSELIAAVEKGRDRLTLNGEEIAEELLAPKLRELDVHARRAGLELKVWVLAPRSDDPATMAENERQALESVAEPLRVAGLKAIAVPRVRIDRPILELLPKKREPAPAPPADTGWDGRIVVTAILLDPERGNRVVVVFDDPDKRGRIYAEGEELRDRDDRKLPNAKIWKIAEGAVTFVCDGHNVVRPLKGP